MDYTKAIREYIDLEKEVISKLDVDAINDAMNLILKAYEANKKIYIFGNGGSSATASHYQNDFNKGISEYVEKKFNFTCLNDNMATIMAIANDIGSFSLSVKKQIGRGRYRYCYFRKWKF